MDTPLKRYSSGMRLRLAFAVAAHLEPELMLVDEVLAVGDYDFQRRCLDRMSTLSQEGRTVVFVSHDLGAITRLCSRAAWIEHGRVAQEGAADEVVEAYVGSILDQQAHAELPVADGVGVRSVRIVDAHGDTLPGPVRGEPLILELRIAVDEPVRGLDLAVTVMATDGTRVLDEAWSDQPHMPELTPIAGEWLVRLRVPPLLRAADYVVGIWLGTELHTYVHRDVLAFAVAPAPGDRQEWHTRRRAVQPPVQWSSAPDGSRS